MNNIGIGLFLSRPSGAADPLAAALTIARESGFESLLWSPASLRSPAIDAALLQQAGMVVIGGLQRYDEFEQGPENAIAYWKALGVPDLCVEAAAQDASPERIARTNAVLERAGMRCSLRPSRDRALEPHLIDSLFQSVPDSLCINLNVLELRRAGLDPAAYIRRFAGRCPLLCLQDTSPGLEPTPLGQGALEWDAICDASEEAGVEWYIFEQDPAAPDLRERLLASYEFIAERA